MPFIAPLLAAASAAFTAATSTGIFASFAAFLKGGSLLATIVKAGFAMAAQYALGALFAPKATATSSQLEVTYGDDVPRSAILGRCAIAGQHVFRNAFGSGNRTVSDVYALSHFRVSEIRRVKGDGAWRIMDDDVGYIPGIEGAVEIRKHYGRMDQAVDSWLVSNSGGRWKSTATGTGVAYAIATSNLTRDGLTQPWEPLFEVYGPYLYDWRKDTSVGGDGDDRWNDQDSWSGNRENPVLQMYLLERGIYNGTELMIGKGVPASRLPLAEWTIAANICDEGGSVPRYRASIIAGAGEGITHDSNMQPLLEACAASWVEDATGEYPIVGAAQAVVATFTDDDLVIGESFRFSKYRKRTELVNTVSGTFIDPDIFYEDAPIATRIDTGALAEDGERLAVSLPFKAVTYSEQADRLADIQTRASRYQANADIALRPKFIALKPGRWVTWISDKYGERTFLVMSKRLGAIGSSSVRNVYLALQEIGEGVFDPTAYETVPTTTLPPGTPDYAAEVDNISVTAWSLTSESSGAIAAIKVTFDEILDTTIVAVDFEYWPTAQPAEVMYATLLMPATAIYLTGVISSTEYQGRYKLRSDPPRNIPWVSFGPVTTTAVALDITVTLAQLSPTVRTMFQGLLAQQELARQKLQQLATAVLDGITQASSANGVAVRQGNANAAALTELEASITGFDDDITALATAMTAVNATLGTNDAGALFRLLASAGSGGVVARIELQVRASTGSGSWTTAGTIWEVGTTPSLFGRIVLQAAKTVIADNGGNILALFDPTGVYIENARIANLTAANITAAKLDAAEILQDGTALRDLIAIGAISEFVQMDYSFSTGTVNGVASFNEGNYINHGTFIIPKIANVPCIQFIDLKAILNISPTAGTADAFIEIWRGGNGTRGTGTRVGVARRRKADGTGTALDITTSYLLDANTSVRYDIFTWNEANAGGGSQYNLQVIADCGLWVFYR